MNNEFDIFYTKLVNVLKKEKKNKRFVLDNFEIEKNFDWENWINFFEIAKSSGRIKFLKSSNNFQNDIKISYRGIDIYTYPGLNYYWIEYNEENDREYKLSKLL